MSYLDVVRKIEADIRGPHGFSVMGVFGSAEAPGFSYTIGLGQTRGWPELVIVGVDPRTGHHILNAAAARLAEEGTPPAAGLVIPSRTVANYALRLATVSPESRDEWMVQLVARQRRAAQGVPDALQVVYPDVAGRWPGEPGYDLDPRVQPLLGPTLN